MPRLYSTTALLAAGTIVSTALYVRERHLRRAYAISHFGILAPAATRYALAHQRGPVDVIVLDIRKMHELNSTLGYNACNVLVGQLLTALATIRTGHGRPVDLAGQWGGDEIVYCLTRGTGRGFLARMLEHLERLSATLTTEQRAQLAQRTGGLVDGLCVAACLVEGATDALAAVEQGLAAVDQLKHGRETGERATSGAIGTVTAIVAAQ